MLKQTATGSGNNGDNLRPKRSRKDRPCDHCRRAKRSCHISVRGEACSHCRKANRQCSFNAPPLNRHKTQHVPEQPDVNGDTVNSGLSHGHAHSHSYDHDPPSASTSGHYRPSQSPASVGPSHDASTSPFSGDPPLSSSSATHSGLSGPPLQLPRPNVYRTHNPPPLSLASWSNAPPTHTQEVPAALAERSTLIPSGRNSVTTFLDSLEEDPASSRWSYESHNIGAGPSSARLMNDNDNYNSLDMDVTEEEESHYLGSGAVAQLASVSLDAQIEARNTASLPYRQVADPRYPAYFLKNPSKVYGLSNAAYAAEKAYQDVVAIISADDPSMPERLIEHFLTKNLPALPVLNHVRFEASLRGWNGADRFPCGVLLTIFAHAAVYEPSLRRHCKEMWGIVLNLLDNEYRQPRLQTLQIEILNLSGRPIINPGGNHLGICRAIGAIQLLGLHRDCSRWKLPKWERSLRKRIWWAMYIDDKWNSYTFGRPVNMEAARSHIPPLTFDDEDPDAQGRKSGDISAFIALSRLSCVLENLIPLLLDHDGGSRKYGRERAVLAHAASELGAVYRDLPRDLEFMPSSAGYPARPGGRSLQLAHIGVTLLICRLGLERDDFLTLPHVLTATKGALSVIETLAVFLECLKMDDYNSFWTPWSAYQLSNAVTLLLQQAIRVHQHASDEHHSDRERALSDIFALLQRVVSSILVASEHWEVAEAASPRIKSLIKAMPAIPGVEHIQAMLVATDLMPPPPDWPQMEPEPDANILALFDWLNGDRVF